MMILIHIDVHSFSFVVSEMTQFANVSHNVKIFHSAPSPSRTAKDWS